MKKIYTLVLAALVSAAALAQSHPMNTKFLPRLHNADVTLPTRHAAPAKAEGQVLPIDMTDPVVLYTNEAYSQPGHYDYYFSFANSDDEYLFPMVFFDLYLPTADGLQEGTYKMSEGTVDPNLMLMANYNDYIYYYYGYAAYEWADATITLTKGEADDAWTVDFSATSTDGYTYTFVYTGEFTVEIDDFDPNEEVEPDQPDVEYTYDYEPAEATQMDIVFEVPDVYDGYVDEYGIYDIYLDSKQQDANGRFYEGQLYLFTNEAKPKADFYPVNSTEALGTFLASYGCSGGSTDLPCFIRTYDDTYVYDSWYIVAGYINVGYDAEGQMTLDGNVETYNGSQIHISTVNLFTEGLHSVIADNVSGTPAAKMIRDGKVYIQGGRGLYTTAGQRVK